MKLYYHYDKEADALYFSQGKPNSKDISQETNNDVIIRVDTKTKKVKGFTVLNFSKRQALQTPVSLPVNIQMAMA